MDMATQHPAEDETIIFIASLVFGFRNSAQIRLRVISPVMKSIEISQQQFRQLSQQISEIAAQYLEGINDRQILPEGNGADIERLFRTPLPEIGIAGEALAGLKDVVRCSRAQNGRFFGYVLGSGDTVGAAADLLCSALNQNVTAWRSAPAAVTLERVVVGWLAESIGCRQFAGVLTGGGSSANLMGLAMAREAKAPANESGVRGVGLRTVYTSTEAHMSISKAIALLGIGRENLRLIPVDESFRMVPEELDRRIQKDKALGFVPLAVIATAGTVNTGAIDPVPEIAEIAAKNEAWLHVDGSYGALAAIAVPGKFSGLDRADSLALDPHKWLYQPLDCGCLLYRDPQVARATFAHSGEYARVLSDDPIEGFAFFEESIELSRRFRALKLWFSLRFHGFAAFRDSINKDLQHAQRLARLVVQAPELELMAPIELSAVCFRYVGNRKMPVAELNRLNAILLQRINARGHIYLSNAMLNSKFCLRACIVNHRTTDSDIDAVLPELLSVARELISR
jgi:glutamate/tyrosine decarboxylase-like PLP-dependent enzyme